MTYTIIVHGNPAPQGSKRHVGGGVMIESSKKVKPWRQDVVAAAVAVRNGAPTLEGPIRCNMVFTLPKPVAAPKRRRTYPDKKPDLSKLIRSTEDALTTAGIWRDDARVVELSARKVFPMEDDDALASPGVRITVECMA